MAKRFSAATPKKMGRQPMAGSNHCTGKVEASMPSDPVMSIQELARTWLDAGNQRRNPVKGAIKQALTPTPVNKRATKRWLNSVAIENVTLPSTANNNRAHNTLRGPRLSNQRPMGN